LRGNGAQDPGRKAEVGEFHVVLRESGLLP
jgi:hypothetical protein